MKRILIACTLIVAAVTGTPCRSTAAELHLFAGAGLRQPIDELIAAFQAQTGHRVVVDYGGSGQQLTRIETTRKGDLFMPGSLFYIEKLTAAGLVSSSVSVVQHTPVIGVNPRQADRIRSFEDLALPGLRLGLGDPEAMALGRTALTILEKSGLKEPILKNVVVRAATVKQLALYVTQGLVDAAIVGRADAVQNADQMNMVTIPASYFQPEIIAVAVLKMSAQPAAAASLQQFLSSRQAVTTFNRFGFLSLEKAAPSK
jgi:molybdate transport system substrate-binding protein